MPLTRPTKPKPFTYAPPDGPLKIIYEDDNLLALSKPYGLLSVPGKPLDHRDCLETRAKEAYPDALLIHRLDMETSGVFLMARNKETQKNLGHQFQNRETHKIYIARVWGQIDGESGDIDMPLCCDWENRPMQMVCHENGRSSQTHWEVISRDEISTRVKLTPHTGRSHQLRVHMLELGNHDQGGHPILGDDFYAHETAHKAVDRLQLHALSLTIHNPDGGAPLTFTDPCPF